MSDDNNNVLITWERLHKISRVYCGPQNWTGLFLNSFNPYHNFIFVSTSFVFVTDNESAGHSKYIFKFPSLVQFLSLTCVRRTSIINCVFVSLSLPALLSHDLQLLTHGLLPAISVRSPSVKVWCPVLKQTILHHCFASFVQLVAVSVTVCTILVLDCYWKCIKRRQLKVFMCQWIHKQT